MSLVVTWDNVPDAAGFEIYRSKTKFSLSTLPTDKVSVPAGATEYEYTDVERQTVYWFAIRTVDANGAGTFGQIFPLGYFPDTGPGPAKLLRGTWEFGFFGEVDSKEVGSYADIYNALLRAGVTTPYNGSTITDLKYAKCVVGGKIIFIPLTPVQGVKGNTAGLVGFAGVGTSDDTTAPVIKLSNRDYRHRVPRASISKPTDTPLVLDVLSDDVLKSEVGMIAALNNSTAETGVSKNPGVRDMFSLHLRLGDYPGLESFMTLHREKDGYSISNSFYSYSVIPGGGGAIASKYWSVYDTYNYLPVLELLF
ncbi:hypothetical protein NFI00_000182 [Salmonella enterica]|nr:hypothetical protein [Salmonella enterica]